MKKMFEKILKILDENIRRKQIFIPLKAIVVNDLVTIICILFKIIKELLLGLFNNILIISYIT